MSETTTEIEEVEAQETSTLKLTRAIEVATKASAAIIAIRCPPTEVFRVVETVQLSATSTGSAFRMWSQIMGWGIYENRAVDDILNILGEESEETIFNPIKPSATHRAGMYDEAFSLMAEVRDDATGEDVNKKRENFPDDCWYTMVDAHYYFEESGFIAYIRRQAQRSYEMEQRLFIVMPDTSEIPDSLAPFFHIIDYEYPGEYDLSQLLELMIEAIEDEDERPVLTPEDIRVIALTGLGMTKAAFENAIALAISDWYQDHPYEEHEEPPPFEHLMKWVRNYKMEILRKTEVLEMQEAIPVEEIGGLQNYKDWMDVRKKTFTPEARERGITPSRGVLVVGVPGTGKSLIAKAAGSQLALPVVRFDIGRVFGSFIGQSEGRMRTVLKQLDAMAPCVLMVDEIDKGFAGMGSGGGNDSGTSARVFGTFLTWMQERPQKERPIFLVFTANRVDGLPPELMRPGRLDEKFAVNAPNIAERADILRIHAKKRNLKIRKEDMPTLVKITDRMVGAEIEALIEQCLIHAFTDDSDTLSVERFEEERNFMRLMADSFRANIDAINAWTRDHARPASAEVETLLKKKPAGDGAPPAPRRGIIKKPKPKLH